MKKYFEDSETGIYAPTLEALKTSLAEFYWDESSNAHINNITYNNKLVIKKSKFSKILPILEKIANQKDADVRILNQKDIIKIDIFFALSSEDVFEFDCAVNKKLAGWHKYQAEQDY